MTEKFDKEKLIRYWIESSDNDFKTMKDLFETKNYNWSLFMGHLVIEKLLKAQYIFIKNEFPFNTRFTKNFRKSRYRYRE